ncbi:hypothetical protein [Streptomyces sp. NPDC058385]|uniref:hypothetical protein n=1 Tax=Streptomyces sp. NPDC058385 TaxID=3346473 RepID=UPI0036572E04
MAATMAAKTTAQAAAATQTSQRPAAVIHEVPVARPSSCVVTAYIPIGKTRFYQPSS